MQRLILKLANAIDRLRYHVSVACCRIAFGREVRRLINEALKDPLGKGQQAIDAIVARIELLRSCGVDVGISELSMESRQIQRKIDKENQTTRGQE